MRFVYRTKLGLVLVTIVLALVVVAQARADQPAGDVGSAVGRYGVWVRGDHVPIRSRDELELHDVNPCRPKPDGGGLGSANPRHCRRSGR